MIHVNYKVCPRCGETKPAYDFGFRKAQGRLTSWCVSCTQKRSDQSELSVVRRHSLVPHRKSLTRHLFKQLPKEDKWS